MIKRLKDKNSTLGFEILNEPQIFRQVDFKKVGNYHDYIIKNISAITDKTYFFALLLPQLHLVQSIFHGSRQRLGHQLILETISYLMSTRIHLDLTMEYYKVISSLMKKIPMYVVEFNAGINKGVTIDGRQFKEYIKRLKHSNVYGGAFWKGLIFLITIILHLIWLS